MCHNGSGLELGLDNLESLPLGWSPLPPRGLSEKLVQWSEICGEVWQELAVVVDNANEGPQLREVPWLWSSHERFHLHFPSPQAFS